MHLRSFVDTVQKHAIEFGLEMFVPRTQEAIKNRNARFAAASAGLEAWERRRAYRKHGAFPSLSRLCRNAKNGDWPEAVIALIVTDTSIC